MRFVVAFSSPKRSARTVEAAARHAKALGAEVVLIRILPDPDKVGIVAQLISSDRPENKAKSQIDDVVGKLTAQGLKASGEVRIGEVAVGIIQAAVELKADLLFAGTTDVNVQPFPLMKKDPIVHYLVNNSPISLFLVRHDPAEAESEYESDTPDTE